MIHLSYYVDQIYQVEYLKTPASEDQKNTLVEYLNTLEVDGVQIVSVAPLSMDGRWIYYLITWRDTDDTT